MPQRPVLVRLWWPNTVLSDKYLAPIEGGILTPDRDAPRTTDPVLGR